MGVQGSGKSTLGGMLAARLGVGFLDSDTLHTPENVALMASGIALTDEARLPWLREVGRILAANESGGIVVACSSLKRCYRDLLREESPGLFVVDPEGTLQLITERVGTRRHEYMPPELLQSQFDILEPLQSDEFGVIVDIVHEPRVLVEQVVAALEEQISRRVAASEQR
jgi:gluconokinase